MRRSVIGVDIGRTAVRAVELRPAGLTGTLRRSASLPLDPGVVEAGVVVDPPAVTAALREMWKRHRFPSRTVRLGISSGSVLVRQVELDWMPPGDLRRALRYQVADLLPVSVDDANLDHVPLGEHDRPDPDTGQPRRMVRILLVATARGVVDETVRAVQAAGLRPITADLAPLALVRAATAAQRAGFVASPAAPRPEAAGVAEAVIDVGADKLAVAVHTGGVPHFVRVVAGVGGDSISRAEDAAQGVARTVAEIRATLEFHEASDPAHRVGRAVLAGAGSRHAGFAEQCERALGVPVSPLNLAHVLSPAGPHAGPEGDSPEFLVCAGLCLGDVA